MKQKEVLELIHSKHNVSHAQKEGMVYQVWEDGEITLQKCGELLWQRNLHLISGGLDKSLPFKLMPMGNKSHGWAFVESMEVAEELQKAIDSLEIEIESPVAVTVTTSTG